MLNTYSRSFHNLEIYVNHSLELVDESDPNITDNRSPLNNFFFRNRCLCIPVKLCNVQLCYMYVLMYYKYIITIQKDKDVLKVNIRT